MIMAIFSIFSWWYGRGFQGQLGRVQAMFASIYDYFSIDLLLKTLFSPFRQISAGSVRGPIGVQLRAFADRVFSRVIGAVVRIFMIIFGVVACIITGVVACIGIIFWLVAPALPVLGLIISLTGWIPWQV